MEQARTFLFILFVFLSFLIYQQWQEDHQVETVSSPIETSIDSYTDLQSSELSSPEPQASNNSQEINDDIASQVPEQVVNRASSLQSKSVKPIKVTTDTLKVLITPNGGNLVSAELLNYKLTLDDDSELVNILENRDSRTFVALSGLYGKGAPDFKRNIAYYQSKASNYVLKEGKNELTVDMQWNNDKGVEYIKRFIFERGKHVIRVEYLVNNLSNSNVINRMFTSLKRDRLPVKGTQSSGLGMQAFVGPAYSTQESPYEKYSFDDLDDEKLKIETQGGWVAILQHYFVTAWVPLSESTHLIDATTKTKDLGQSGLAQIRITQDWQTIQPGESKSFASKLYVGPKIQSDLETVEKNLDLTIDYGWLWWIGQPLFYLLIFFQKYVVSNWGVAIILLTIVVKALLYPLARAQYRSFAKMRLLAPKMTAMKERYGDDRQQMSMKMMELYKKEKVNPLGGCFPLLIQMPVFIALYWVLMESVELRHAPFMLWINDLSVKDPSYILPLLMGASMYLMQKMQPMSPTMDPMQQKIFQLMPVFMTIFFVFFPAGLVLYWLMNNLISIAQQLYITKQFNREQEVKNKSKNKK